MLEGAHCFFFFVIIIIIIIIIIINLRIWHSQLME
jgi:hypothetical protein